MITYIQIIYNFSTLLRCATVPRKIWSAVLLKDESHAFLSYCKMEALMSLLLENLWRFLGLLGKSFYDLFLTHLQTTAAASHREETSLREVSLMFLWSFLKVQEKKWAVRRKLAIYTFFPSFCLLLLRLVPSVTSFIHKLPRGGEGGRRASGYIFYLLKDVVMKIFYLLEK